MGKSHLIDGIVSALGRLAAAALICGITISSAHAKVFVPDGLEPGDTYHLLFITAGSNNANASLIDPYNKFVQEEAEMNPSLTGTDQGITYKVVASSLADNISARNNAVVEAPVYLMNGTLIADGFDDLWNTAMIDNKLLPAPINVTQFGVVDTTSSLAVATGTNFDGTLSNNPLGNISGINELTTLGNGLVRGPQWIDDVSGPNGPLVNYRFYGLSEKITVIPEPTALPLLAIGLVGVAVARKRKKPLATAAS